MLASTRSHALGRCRGTVLRVASAAIVASFVVMLVGTGLATALSAAAPPKAELQTYFAELGRENSRFARLKQQTRASMNAAYALGSMTLDMVSGTSLGPSMAAVKALTIDLRKQSAAYEATAVRLQAVRTPEVLRREHVLLIRALRVASAELASRAKPLESTVRDGTVNVGSIRDFDQVVSPLKRADDMAKAWRVATGRYAARLDVTPPARMMTFGKVTP